MPSWSCRAGSVGSQGLAGPGSQIRRPGPSFCHMPLIRSQDQGAPPISGFSARPRHLRCATERGNASSGLRETLRLANGGSSVVQCQCQWQLAETAAIRRRAGLRSGRTRPLPGVRHSRGPRGGSPKTLPAPQATAAWAHRPQAASHAATRIDAASSTKRSIVTCRPRGRPRLSRAPATGRPRLSHVPAAPLAHHSPCDNRTTVRYRHVCTTGGQAPLPGGQPATRSWTIRPERWTNRP